uniref:RNA-directed RNA polymerase n=1 Tax=Beihai levi-like virus 20 TaxID=1922406 RepID=A0A1L3KI07_9VIRU|nr:hypothetical protein [Beihai levi-like virus 20]
MEKSTTRAFQKILTSFRFTKSDNVSEEFAIQRYLKKMEIPDPENMELRRESCWTNWLATDLGLPRTFSLLPGDWYRARSLLHSWLSDFTLGPVSFPTGSEFTPTRGKNSIEAKLCLSTWTCTPDCFDSFCKTAYEHKGLKRAVKKRFKTYVDSNGFDLNEANAILWRHFKSQKDPAWSIFSWKCSRVVTFVHGSRFSTVPKNNEKDRPINIEPFCNVLIQKRVGDGLRNVLKKRGIYLDNLPALHQGLIADISKATIDLKDASDSISIALCEFLLPKRILNVLHSCRSDMVLGLDGNFHVTNKISSMGNGFTFELMTLILTAICRVLDPGASVFGDDIILRRTNARTLISLLTRVGFTVNEDKSFWIGPFRESCGANWHHDYGYFRSFDFRYPQNIHDCVVIYNKVVALSREEGFAQFTKLENCLRRTIPFALRGKWTLYDSIQWKEGRVSGTSPVLSGYFRCPKSGRIPAVSKQVSGDICRRLSYQKVTGSFYSFEYKPKLRSPNLKHLKSSNWAKYEMYLDSGRRAKDVLTDVGVWVRKVCVILDGERVYQLATVR